MLQRDQYEIYISCLEGGEYGRAADDPRGFSGYCTDREPGLEGLTKAEAARIYSGARDWIEQECRQILAGKGET